MNKNKKTVSYIYYHKYRPKDSNNTQIINTVNAISDVRYDVTLHYPTGLEKYIKKHGLTSDFASHSYDFCLRNELLNRFLYYLFSVYNSTDSDIIFTRDISLLKFLRLLPSKIYPPMIYEAHQCYSGIGSISKTEERKRINEADAVITQSEGVTTDLESIGINVDATVPNAANEAYLPANYPESIATQLDMSDETITIIYAGSLNEWKNDIELMIKSIFSLEYSNIELLIVGGEEDRLQELRTFSKRYGADPDQISFVGRVPHKDVFKYLTISDVGVVPLSGDSPQSKKYTSPIKLFEYLLCGLNVVAADVPATTSIHSDQIFYYEPQNEKDMVNAMNQAIESESPETNTKYTYKKRASKIDKVINNIK